MATEVEVEDFLAHHGVKGMRWGVRGTKRVQKRLDRLSRVASGTATKKDRLLAANRYAFTKKGASRQLQRGANQQAKMAAGKQKVTKLLIKVNGVKVENLDFHTKGDAKAKLDNGQKAAVGILIGAGALKIAGAIAKR